VAERFEVTGTVDSLEQRRYRDERPIEGLWAVRLRTADGRRTVSFNSTVPVDWDDPRGERRPHPDFAVLQDAMASGQTVQISGTVAEKGDRTYLNGTRAKVVEGAPASAPPGRPEGDDDGVDKEDAKWAVALAVQQVEISDRESIDELRTMSAALLLVAEELAEDGIEGAARRAMAGRDDDRELEGP